MPDLTVAEQHFAQMLGVDAWDPNALQRGLTRQARVFDFGRSETARMSYKVDFIEDDVAEDSSVLINQAGTPTTAAAVGTAAGGTLNGHGGWLAGSVDNVDAEIDEVALGAKPWLLVSSIPSGFKAYCEIGLVVPVANTARQYFFGWTDDETEGTATNGSLNVQTARTVVDVATDAVGFILSSLATAPTVWKYANTNANTQSTNATDTTITSVVDEYTVFRVGVDSAGNAVLDGSISAGRGKALTRLGSVSLAVATTAVLVPLFAAAATTTTAVEWEIDYMSAYIAA